jgi:hypothetical protein
MVESSDLQSAIARTQAAERIQQLHNQQEEMNRKRFELEMARQRAEKGTKVQNAQEAEHKRVVRDRYDGEPGKRRKKDEKRRGADSPGEGGGTTEEEGGGFDVRV